ncbi:hypothetical protein [Bacillus sp. AP8]|uniref:hypothetical protein n=1 Tax=Bacillus sp. AP8 TaxID=1513284 RepID=UPI000382A569|nr:hypothetical protein [Bacillus sp. AP8]
MKANLTPIKSMYHWKGRRFYLSTKKKFWISHAFSACWLAISIYISLPWLHDLASVFSLPFAIFVITGIAYIPGYMSAFLIISLILDRQDV